MRDGRLPGPTSAYGNGYGQVSRSLSRSGESAFRYTVTFHVTSAEARAEARRRGMPGRAYMYISASARHYSETYGYIWGDGGMVVVDSAEEMAPASATDETFTFSFTMEVPPSDQSALDTVFDIWVDGYADAGNSVDLPALPRGSSSLSADLEIVSVTVEPIA